MTIDIKKTGASKQAHTNHSGDKAVIEEHGHSLKITINVDYNRLTPKQIPYRHKAIHELVAGAIETAAQLRASVGSGLIAVDELEPTLPLDIDMDPMHS